MIPNRDQHYCKWCKQYFLINIHDKETGDFILQCPTCDHPHYRRFEDGVAVHCDIDNRTGEPIRIKGKYPHGT